MSNNTEKHYVKNFEGKIICIEDYQESLLNFPSKHIRQVLDDSGRAAVTGLTYMNYSCGCSIEGCGTLQFPMRINFCDKHSKEQEPQKLSFTLEDAKELLKKEGYFVHHPDTDPVIPFLDVNDKGMEHLRAQLEEQEVYSYMDMGPALQEHLYSIEQIKEKWEEGDVELGPHEQIFLDEVEANMARYDCAYFRFIR